MCFFPCCRSENAEAPLDTAPPSLPKIYNTTPTVLTTSPYEMQRHFLQVSNNFYASKALFKEYSSDIHHNLPTQQASELTYAFKHFIPTLKFYNNLLDTLTTIDLENTPSTISLESIIKLMTNALHIGVNIEYNEATLNINPLHITYFLTTLFNLVAYYSKQDGINLSCTIHVEHSQMTLSIPTFPSMDAQLGLLLTRQRSLLGLKNNPQHFMQWYCWHFIEKLQGTVEKNENLTITLNLPKHQPHFTQSTAQPIHDTYVLQPVLECDSLLLQAINKLDEIKTNEETRPLSPSMNTAL